MNPNSKNALTSAIGSATEAAGVAGTAFGQFGPTAGNGGNGAAGGDGGTVFFINDTATAKIYILTLPVALPIFTRSGQRCGRQSVRNSARTKGGKGGNGGKGGKGGNAFNRF